MLDDLCTGSCPRRGGWTRASGQRSRKNAAMLRPWGQSTGDALDAAREHNFKRYHYQGIGRYEPDAVYARGVADLAVLADLLPGRGFLFGSRPRSVDGGNLRVHRQHPLLRDRHPAEGFSRVAAKPRGALPVGARPARGVSGRPGRAGVDLLAPAAPGTAEPALRRTHLRVARASGALSGCRGRRRVAAPAPLQGRRGDGSPARCQRRLKSDPPWPDRPSKSALPRARLRGVPRRGRRGSPVLLRLGDDPGAALVLQP